MARVYAVLSIALILLNEAGSFEGSAGRQEGTPGADNGFRIANDLPTLAYPGIAALIFLVLLLVTFSFRNVNKRH